MPLRGSKILSAGDVVSFPKCLLSPNTTIPDTIRPLALVLGSDRAWFVGLNDQSAAVAARVADRARGFAHCEPAMFN
jgi:hypothetical protein